MTIRTWIAAKGLHKNPKKIRIRNGVREALFGGYAMWWRNDKRYEKEVRIWAPASIQDDDCGAGTDEIVKRLLKKIDIRGERKAEITESWRY
jgi:hypothetical protein